MEDNVKKNSTEKTEENIENQKMNKLDALLMDDDMGATTVESAEEAASFEAFMKDYRSLIGKVDNNPEADEITEEDESEFLISLPRRGNRKALKVENDDQKKVSRGDWNDDITLAPQEYTDPGEEDKIMVDELPEEEPTPDFNLGETAPIGDDKFQLSIDFTGETDKEAEEEPREERKYDPDKPRLIDWFYDFAEMIVFVLLVVMILTAFVFKHAVVDGPSMNNTLQHGEHLIISDLFYTPERGDIIVFEDHSTILKKPVVKRVIGLEGDTIRVELNEDDEVVVYVNDELLDEKYAYNAKDCRPAVGMTVTVPEGEIFVMGDNRYHSADSRDGGVGTIKVESILGKVLFRFYPFDKFGSIE